MQEINDSNKGHLKLNTMDMLLAKVNKVTCPFRHGQKIQDKDLVALSNFQIEAEEWLSKYRDQIAGIIKNPTP